MKRAGVVTTERKLLCRLYKNEIAIIKMGHIKKKSKIKKCVGQECTLSSLMFNAHIQESIDTLREGGQR